MKVLIDNGHGRETPGKRSPVFSFGQLMEWEWSRAVAKLLVKEIEALNIEAVLITPETSDVLPSERARRINKYFKADPQCVAVSIHANASAEGKAHGWECWSDLREDESDVLGTDIYSAVQRVLPFKMRPNTSKDFVKDKDFTILYLSQCPMVLTENGFMDNEQECKYMLSPEGKLEIARCHAAGIYTYLKRRYGIE